jgi:hypothetical protein
MKRLGFNGAFQVQMQFGFREIEDKFLKMTIQLAGNGGAPGKLRSSSCST